MTSAELLENGGKIRGGLENFKANVRNLYCGISWNNKYDSEIIYSSVWKKIESYRK